MKALSFSLVAALLSAAPLVQGEAVRDPAQSPCFNVSVQNERVNRSVVEQDCQRNYGRTVQAGQSNWAQTVQSGEVNDNKVRQYQYEHLRYPDRKRGQ
jgi:Ni/Co efflux regulator RcnB